MNKAQQTLELLEKQGYNTSAYSVLNIKHRFNNWEEVFSSDEYNIIWEGFQSKERTAKVHKRMKFIGAFVTEENASMNYGRDFRVYTHYQTPDGMMCIQELEITSSITSYPMREVLVYDDSVLFTDRCYKKNDEARNHIIKNKLTVI